MKHIFISPYKSESADKVSMYTDSSSDALDRMNEFCVISRLKLSLQRPSYMYT